MNDWKAEISRIVYWKQIAAQHDKNHALPWHLPKVGASQEEVRRAENALGVAVPDQLKELLQLVNGWPGFYISVDLFGAKDFIEGRSQAVMARPDLQEFILEMDLNCKDVFAIGASELESDVFICVSAMSPRLPGNVIWFAGEEIDTYPSVAEFFSAMVGYNERIAQKLAGNI